MSTTEPDLGALEGSALGSIGIVEFGQRELKVRTESLQRRVSVGR